MKRGHILALVLFLGVVAGVLWLSPRRTQEMQAGFLNMLAPFLRTGSALQLKVSEFTEGLKTLGELEDENKAIKIEVKNLKATNQLLRDLAEENKRLRNALLYRERSVFKLVPARIIARDSTSWWNTVKIDRGFEDGIESEMAVLTEEGLVGKTTTVAKSISVVLLIADETCKVAVNVEGTREQGILAGTRISTTSSPLLELRFLSKEANLRPGQRVYSSGVGGVFPSGVLAGTIRKFEAKEIEGSASVVPAVDLSTLQDVFIVIGRNQ